MDFTNLPTLNAVLNLISTVFLLRGRIYIMNGNRAGHKKFMIGALISSALFLVFYSIYHVQVGSVPYPYHDWSRIVYFLILIPHIIMAALMGPFIIMAVVFAIRERFDVHRKIVRWVWPVWIYVSVSGILIYIMLYIR